MPFQGAISNENEGQRFTPRLDFLVSIHAPSGHNEQ